MPAIKVSNPRDLLAQLLGEMLFVERRLADEVIRELASAVQDDELRGALEEHREQTEKHVERIETAFRRLGLAPTSNLSRPFESAVAQHDALADAVIDPRLSDLFHANTALHTEHEEIAAYTMILTLAAADGRGSEVEQLESSLEEEQRACRRFEQIVARIAEGA